MYIKRDNDVIYNPIDNSGSSDLVALGAQYTKGRLDTLDGRFAGYYTKAEVLELLTGVAATLIVAELPETPEANTYYLVGNDGDGYVLHYYDTELEPALENKCYQYVGTGDVYEFGVWYRCENVSWYAWLNSANANTYFTKSATPDVHAAIYNSAKERMPAKVVSATATTMTDTTNTTYTRNSVADTSEYMWVPLHTKLSQFENDGDGTNADGDKFITRVNADARYVQPSTEATLTSKTIDADLNTIAGWSVLVFSLITFYKIKTNGFLGYLKGYTEPIKIFTPFNILSELGTPISMTFRHFGNVVSGVVISTLVYAGLASLSTLLLGWLPGLLGKIPFLQVGIPAVLSIYFDLFSSCMQAFIFAMLTMLYIGNAAKADN